MGRSRFDGGVRSVARMSDPHQNGTPGSAPEGVETDPLVETRGTDPDLATTADNDAVAGETVLGQPGSGDGGSTGGAEKEGEPMAADNDLRDDEIDLEDLP